MSRSAKHTVVEQYIRAYRLRHGEAPAISESKGFLWVNGRGGFMLEEIEEMTDDLLKGASSTPAHAVIAGAR